MFPFDLPLPSATYSALFVATFALHLLSAQFVLAGSGYVACCAIRSPKPDHDPIGLHALLRDWLPFGMGITITLGVAPLLFVQVLDQKAFYTANLLLFHRWMAVLPVLILAFYLLYAQKSSRRLRESPVWGRLAPAMVFACVAFVGFSFGENHLLSQDREAWAAFYGRGALFYRTGELLPRFGTMLAAAFPGLAVVVVWLVRCSAQEARPAMERTLRRWAIVGTVVTALGIGWTGSLAGTARQDALLATSGLPWVWILCGGWFATVAVLVFFRDLSRRAIPLTLSWGVFLLGLAGVREVMRWSRMDRAQAQLHHERVWASGGTVTFVLLLFLVGALVAWCLLRVRADLRRGVDSRRDSHDRSRQQSRSTSNGHRDRRNG